MTLHEEAIKAINRIVRGKVVHSTHAVTYKGMVPDIVKQNAEGKLLQIHEVEAPAILRGKVGQYSDPFELKPTRVLWVVLPNLKHAFHNVHLLMKTDQGFVQLRGEQFFEAKLPGALE